MILIKYELCEVIAFFSDVNPNTHSSICVFIASQFHMVLFRPSYYNVHCIPYYEPTILSPYSCFWSVVNAGCPHMCIKKNK